MSLHYIYSDAPLSTIDITDRCRTYVLSVKDNAEEGSVAISNLIIDDPLGDLTITGHRRLYIYEDTAPVNNQIIFNGFVVNERLIRGPSGRTEASRQWVIDLADVNVLINRRIMNGADASRPVENDTDRILALLTMTELNTVDDDSLVSLTAATAPMDAVDYRGQNVGAYIDDCRQQSGKNAYIYYNETLGEYGLWYDFDYSTAYDSGKFLSNTLGEADQSTTFQYSRERTYLNVDPSRVASGIYLEYDGGLVYAQDPTTTDAFAAIDWAAPSLNVKTFAKAEARANRYLADAATEDYIVHTVMTAVPSAQVNAVKKGQLVQFKAEWMAPFYDEYSTFRVLYRTVNEISEDPSAAFEIEMDLSPVTAPSTPQIFTHVQSAGCNTGQWPEGSPGAGLLLVGVLVQRGGTLNYMGGVEPIGNVGPVSSCVGADVAGTEWDYLGSKAVNTNEYPQTMAMRFPSVLGEPAIIRWGGSGGLGSTGPRSYQIALEDMAGTEDGYTSSAGFGNTGTVFTSHAYTISAPGIIIASIMRRSAGPADGSSPAYVFTARAPAVDLLQGYANSGFAPNSWFGMIEVTPAMFAITDTYTITLDCSAIPRNPGDPWSWQMDGFPFA